MRGRLSAVVTLWLAAAGVAQAQSTVTVFGLIDAGVEVMNHVGPGSSRLWRVPSLTGGFASRLGFRGSEDLGGGLSASFVLEMGFAPDQGTSTQGGRVMGRQTLVALGTPYGQFSVGRQYTMLFWSLLEADILGPNLYGSGSLDAGIPNARADNALAWRDKYGPWQLGATYSLGRDSVNAGPSPAGTNCAGEEPQDASACREWSWLVKYDVPGWGVALADDRLHGRKLGPAPDTIYGGLDSSAKVDDRLSLNGYLDIGAARVSAGLVRRRNDGDAAKRDSDLWYVGAAYKVLPEFVVDGEWLTLRYRGASDFNSTLLALRATYNFSRRTAVYAQVGHIANQARSALAVSAGAAGGNPVAGGAQSGANMGLRHGF
jgi:predicted porin